MVYATYNELVTGAYKPTYTWGRPHCNPISHVTVMFVEWHSKAPSHLWPFIPFGVWLEKTRSAAARTWYEHCMNRNFPTCYNDFHIPSPKSS